MSSIKIAVTGPEASGKTMLALALSRYLNAKFIEDYCSYVLDRKEGNYSIDDIISIANRKIKALNEFSLKDDLIVSDNELLSLKIWCEFAFNQYPETLRSLVNQQYYDLYLLNTPNDMDTLRREDPKLRNYFFNAHKKELDDNKLPYLVLEGDFYNRKKMAVEAIQNLQKTS